MNLAVISYNITVCIEQFFAHLAILVVHLKSLDTFLFVCLLTMPNYNTFSARMMVLSYEICLIFFRGIQIFAVMLALIDIYTFKLFQFAKSIFVNVSLLF